MEQNKRDRSAILNMVGTIIGAGVFGLPVVFARTGVLGGTVAFACLLAVSLAIHLLMTEVVLATRAKHNIPGYAGAALGNKAYWFTATVFFLKLCGTTLAYIILGGEFLWQIMSHAGFGQPVWFWQVLFWAVGSLVVLLGVGFVTAVESELTWLLIGVMVLSFVALFPFFDWQLAAAIDIKAIPNALGVMFFAVSGLSVVPDIVNIAGKNAKHVKSSMVWGTLLAGFLSWLFAVAIVLGYPAIKDAADIGAAFPPIFWWLVPFIGLLAIVTSYLTITQALEHMLHVDARLPRIAAWLVATAVPFLLFAFVSKDFLATIGFVGSVLTASLSFMACLAALAIFQKTNKRVHWFWRWAPVPIAVFLIMLVAQKIISL